MRWLIVLMLTLGLAQTSLAANQPCSGKKGGVAECDGAMWVCNDGSISGSKRNCSAERGGGKSAVPMRAVGNDGDDCPCGTGTLCTGPRGGQYCMTASGNKSYRKH